MIKEKNISASYCACYLVDVCSIEQAVYLNNKQVITLYNYIFNIEEETEKRIKTMKQKTIKEIIKIID